MIVRRGLLEVFATVARDDAVHAAIIIGAGRTFVAGFDISEFGKPLEELRPPAVIAAIEACAIPLVAAIHVFFSNCVRDRKQRPAVSLL
jgi:3-hydroxyacyl-CoA dehydrogenase